MYLSTLTVRGLRLSAQHDLTLTLPGRFSVLVGANSSGKTTIADAAYLGHTTVFPRLPRISAAALGSGERAIEVEYCFEDDPGDEGPLGRQLQAQAGAPSPGVLAAWWRRALSRDLGAVRARTDVGHDVLDAVRLVYLPAWRNPLDELARREARILIELLRAQQQRLNGSRNLVGLRQKAWAFLEALTRDGLIAAVEERISAQLGSLSAGVSRQWAYVRSQVVDDAYLARVLELMLAVLEGRNHARPLDVSGLGYVNLLHIAVTLAAIPDPAEAGTGTPQGSVSHTGNGHADGPAAEGRDAAVPDETAASEDARAELLQARAEAESEEDSFFPAAPFHATVIIEEPEAHLHPQLQHSLVRHLRRTVAERPELQIVLSSHATDIITSCRPEDLVVLRRRDDGQPVTRAIVSLPLANRTTVLGKARLHLDATRSAALFAERVILVEGVTDAALVREFGWAWAGNDLDKQAFIDAVSIVAMGTKVGSWPVELLATRGHELCRRIGVLSDSDKELDQDPAKPNWLTAHDQDVADVFLSHPTLEPSITPGNERLVAAALIEIGIEVEGDVNKENVHAAFRSARKAAVGREYLPAGPGARRKGEFALALAERIANALKGGEPVHVPPHLVELFEFVYPTPADGIPADVADESVIVDAPNGSHGTPPASDIGPTEPAAT